MKVIRFKENPLIIPDPTKLWMTENAFNPGVVKEADKFYMLIRGGNHRRHQRHANIGLATSDDGIKWHVHEEPLLRCTDFGPATENGIEDPRIIRWNGHCYIFATACHKYYGRIGIWRSLNIDGSWEFLGIPFDWEDKDACIIPEVIDGKVYMIHRMNPNMWISETEDKELKGIWRNNRVLLKASAISIDGDIPFKIGLNGPPMKLEGNWFVMFHGRFDQKEIEYRNSFMILDGKNPHNIKYIHSESILRPELRCEKYGAIPYVCFNNGIVDMGDRWYLYWGGADTVVCGGYLLKEEVKNIIQNMD
jgi:predicted GH43/DUF377 family glycosyl hydrolase